MIYIPSRRLIFLSLLSFALLLMVAGCSDDPADPKPDPEPEVFGATDPDSLMADFESAYAGMLIDPFRAMLHADFKMILPPETLDEWGWENDFYFDNADMDSCHAHMFGGEAGRDPEANAIHPINSVVVVLLAQSGDWIAIPDDDADFGDFEGLVGTFNFRFDFYNVDLSHRYSAQGIAAFFVSTMEISGNTIYQILGVREFAIGKASENTNWGDVVAAYR